MTELVFRKALHIPNLTANLVSIRKFDQAGFSVTFMGGKAVFHDPKSREVLVGHKERGMYLLAALDMAVNTTFQVIVASSFKPAEIDLLSQPTPRPLDLLPKPPCSPGVPTNTLSTCPDLCSPIAPTPANSDAPLANSDGLLANPNMFPVGPVTSPSPKPLGPSDTVPDPSICH
ncbi:hypothetical protein H2248_012323 [Termitomyces sp. 'cryptogamus']|nr:hypothetical protein H2248_012323 [Termitomyces sp. 'cryptogamus']